MHCNVNHKEAIFIAQTVFHTVSEWPATLQGRASPNDFRFCVCICWHCSNSLFAQKSGEWTILTTKHGLLASYTTRKFCFLTTSYDHNKFAELKIGKKIFWPQIWRSSFLMLQALVTCCQRLAGQYTCSFAEIMHTSNLYGEHMTACMSSWYGNRPCCAQNIITAKPWKGYSWTSHSGEQSVNSFYVELLHEGIFIYMYLYPVTSLDFLEKM